MRGSPLAARLVRLHRRPAHLAVLRIEFFFRTPPIPRVSIDQHGIQIHTELGSSAPVVRCAYEICV
jgi:hypothetical protein